MGSRREETDEEEEVEQGKTRDPVCKHEVAYVGGYGHLYNYALTQGMCS